MLLRRQGKRSLYYLINHFDKSDVDQERAERVASLLSGIDFRSASDVSEGAAIFHAWVSITIHAVTGHHITDALFKLTDMISDR